MIAFILRALRFPRKLRQDGEIFDRVAALQAPDTCDTCHEFIPAGHYAVKHYRRTPDPETALHIGTTCAYDFGLKITLPRDMRGPRRWPFREMLPEWFARRVS